MTKPAGVTAGILLGGLLVVQAAPIHAAQLTAAPERTTLAGISVAGKSPDEVRKLAAELSARLLAYPVQVSRGKQSTLVSAAKLEGKVDAKAAVDTVFEAPKDEGLISFFKSRFQGPDAREIPLSVQLSEAGVRKGLRRFSVRIGAEPHNARLTKIGGAFKTTPERPGKELDAAALARSIQAALDAAEFRAALNVSVGEGGDRAHWLEDAAPLKLEAPLHDAPPRVTRDELKSITGELATYNTSLGGSSRNRVHNIELACKAVDGTVLMPGDVFSYNDTVGPRVPSAGFREAPVIIKGQLQKGTGGGICQVSSTLYNAALLADMEIVRRQHHAFPVHYLPAGQDATVVDGAIDFRFKNRLAHPVAIDAKVAKGRVTFHIYGSPEDKRQVEIVRSNISTLPTKTETVTDPKLPRGRRVTEKKAMSGHKVTVTRVVKKDGEVLRREVVSRDVYRPVTGTVRVGSAVPAASAHKTKDDGKAGKDKTTPTAPKTDTPPTTADGL